MCGCGADQREQWECGSCGPNFGTYSAANKIGIAGPRLFARFGMTSCDAATLRGLKWT